VNVIREELIHDKAAEIALLSGCRAVDAYYIATAKHANAILITDDKVMRNNALKTGIKTYYLLNDNDYNTLINKLTTG